MKRGTAESGNRGRGSALALVLLSASLFLRFSGSPGAPTFIVEWVRTNAQATERLTLFSDGSLVWKSRSGDKEILRKREATPEELSFYRMYFSRSDFWALAADMTSGVSSDMADRSEIALARPDGSQKRLRFDQLSVLPWEAAALKASLLGLLSSFETALPAMEKYAVDRMPPGTVLTRRDGEAFRVREIHAEKGIVELVGVRLPVTVFLTIPEIRLQFHPPPDRDKGDR